jgi:hypothetical protein
MFSRLHKIACVTKRQQGQFGKFENTSEINSLILQGCTCLHVIILYIPVCDIPVYNLDGKISRKRTCAYLSNYYALSIEKSPQLLANKNSVFLPSVLTRK